MTRSDRQDPEAGAQMVTAPPIAPVAAPEDAYSGADGASEPGRPPAIPQEVYEEAARALVGRFRVGSRNAADAYGYAAAPWLRAAVDAAYQRGLAEGILRRSKEIDALTRGAYEDGKGDGRAEGRRQATGGWDREWGVGFSGEALCTDADEAVARAYAEEVGEPLISRIVGPWEPTEQIDPHQADPARDRYMMATSAIHKLGDTSRDEPDLAIIYDEGETETDYVGQWATGMGLVNMRFPKATTRKLTAEERGRYRGQLIDEAGAVRPIVIEEPTGHAPCPTCSGPARETVGMVCQTCGTDYAPAEQAEADPAARCARDRCGHPRKWHNARTTLGVYPCVGDVASCACTEFAEQAGDTQ